MKRLLFLAVLCWTTACSRPYESDTATCVIVLEAEGTFTRSVNPDEELISDYNLLIFNCFGILEEKVYVPARQLGAAMGSLSHSTTLLRNLPYTLLAAANLGYELPCFTLQDALSYRYPLAYPDEYSRGMPMAAMLENYSPGADAQVMLPLQRLMARVDISIDRSDLDPDVSFSVRELRVGGCPSSARLFGISRVESASQVFAGGFFKAGADTDCLNGSVSRPVSLYLLENCQGDLLEHVTTDSGKVFRDSAYQEICSYVEIKAEYHSESWHTRPDRYLIYRFYLGESLNNFDVRRNTWYRLTVRPEGDGLREDSWRVDKQNLVPEIRMDLHPAAYNECHSGDDFHIWCDVRPKGTPMYIEALAHDDDPRVAELYSYTLDPDGNGLTIHTWKGGTAVIAFSAGAPVNRDTLAMLVIDP